MAVARTDEPMFASPYAMEAELKADGVPVKLEATEAMGTKEHPIQGILVHIGTLTDKAILSGMSSNFGNRSIGFWNDEVVCRFMAQK